MHYGACVVSPPPPWYEQEKGIITKEQLASVYHLVELVTTRQLSSQLLQFEARGVEMVSLFNALLTGVNKDEVVQYVLALMDELLLAQPAFAGQFHSALYATQGTLDAFDPLLKLLSRQHLFTVEKAALVLAKLLSYDHFHPAIADAHAEEVLERKLSSFALWSVALLKSVDPTDGYDQPKVAQVLAAVQQLVATAPGRKAFIKADGLPLLLGLMSGGSYATHSAVQLLYVVLMVVWSLSYTPECAAKLAAAAGLLPKLVDILKNVQKEKVVRVTCAALRNLLAIETCASDMIGAGVMKALQNLQHRKWADEDVKIDVEYLAHALEGSLKLMSSWDVYAKEVASGRLEWSPSHKSDTFWKDNYKAFEAHDCATLKQLVDCLSSSDPTTLAVACHDVGEFIKVRAPAPSSTSRPCLLLPRFEAHA